MQQQLGLIVEGKEKAAVCWHLVTASHYCTDAIKYELDCLRVPRQRRCAPASFFFFVHACVENALLFLFPLVYQMIAVSRR